MTQDTGLLELSHHVRSGGGCFCLFFTFWSIYYLRGMRAMVTVSTSLWDLPFTSASLSQVIDFQIKSLPLSPVEGATPPGRQGPALHQPALATCSPWPCVWLVLPMIMALASSSVAHGSESRKRILNYRGKWCLKRQQFTDVYFFSL